MADPLAPAPESAPPPGATAALVLADGQVFWGRGFGAHTAASALAVGEICFNTGMTGYQETLSPAFTPSTRGALVKSVPREAISRLLIWVFATSIVLHL